MESNSVKINYAGPKQTTLLACGWIVQWKDGSSGHQYCDPPKHCGFISKGKEADFIKTKFYLWSHHRILIFEWHPLGEHPGQKLYKHRRKFDLGKFYQNSSDEPKYMLIFMTILAFYLCHFCHHSHSDLLVAGSVALFIVDYTLFRNNIVSTTTPPESSFWLFTLSLLL